MKLLVTGATGFIGNQLVAKALHAGHEVTVIVRDTKRVLKYDWSDQVDIIVADIGQAESSWPDSIASHDALVHLAWSGLPNYQADFHLEQVLPAHKQFLRQLIEKGIQQILVAGTCLEYGKQEGCLSESMTTYPETPYAIAKDQLREWLKSLQKPFGFTLQWCRLFYMHGVGQNANSLLSQLDVAITNGESVFNMSGGQQQRDFLPVELVAQYLLEVVERQDFDGILNICSGKPITVLELVKKFTKARHSTIKLNLGYYSYPEYEAMAFWGDTEKLKQLVSVPRNMTLGESNESSS